MRLTAAPVLVRCSACGSDRILVGLMAACVEDAHAQGLAVRCAIVPECPGNLLPMVPPAHILGRPAHPQGGRHVASCPGCRAPVLLEYHYGYAADPAPVPCPSCREDLFAIARREWPRLGGAGPMDLSVRLATAPVPRLPTVHLVDPEPEEDAAETEDLAPVHVVELLARN